MSALARLDLAVAECVEAHRRWLAERRVAEAVHHIATSKIASDDLGWKERVAGKFWREYRLDFDDAVSFVLGSRVFRHVGAAAARSFLLAHAAACCDRGYQYGGMKCTDLCRFTGHHYVGPFDTVRNISEAVRFSKSGVAFTVAQRLGVSCLLCPAVERPRRRGGEPACLAHGRLPARSTRAPVAWWALSLPWLETEEQRRYSGDDGWTQWELRVLCDDCSESTKRIRPGIHAAAQAFARRARRRDQAAATMARPAHSQAEGRT